MVEMHGFTGAFYRVCVWIARFAYVNALWVTFTLLGLIVLGFMPATTAMFAVVRRWVQNDHDIPIFKTFVTNYRKDFVKANGLGLFYGLLIGLILVNLALLPPDPLWATLLRYAFMFIGLLTFGALLFLIPVFVHFELSIYQYVRTSIMLALSYPHYAITMTAGMFALQYVFMTVPGLIPFFAASFISYVLMWLSNRVFSHLKKRSDATDYEGQASGV
ncbi:YesL family protein [Halalkalibacterium halodurans]|uniref:YesL family protein n=1 Tax=Halalkalibacterium halodurans TaxID=86665 RepID=UPI00031EB183|nr:YesL family protein [Halalkalibacterium halodurans]MDY7220986.1 YesL family protein [Halalkalibacterium halodurans]MDY7240225.1 YesL family protein [Halalkalibacterium halodurans]MED4079876.1 YesL family protein [Halalkalibacterium halodurans]MED4085305.1 YesL family protein [Halalkalibacterium halodurans]MED4103838.1 YesL family protein [Halalkalibacterium halodurans]